jgi:hypothetical protein
MGNLAKRRRPEVVFDMEEDPCFTSKLLGRSMVEDKPHVV